MLGNRKSQHDFAQAIRTNPRRSRFDRSFTHKTTVDFDRLNPIFVDEVLPGDIINLSVNTFIRLATQKVPIMDNMYVDWFFFFCPSRLVWDNFRKFYGEQQTPGASTNYLIPQVANGGIPLDAGSVADIMGIPTGVTNLSVNALPFRAINLIWNEWFRADQLVVPRSVPKDDGPDPIAMFNQPPPYRLKRHDYFTSANPAPQAGAAVNIPTTIASDGQFYFKAMDNDANAPVRWYTDPTGFTTTGVVNSGAMMKYGSGLQILGTINQLREAFQLQVFFEAEARGGVRFTEILTQHFNVAPLDATLQRPEYLGGGSLRLNSHPVAQTAPTSGTDPQAQLAAFGTGSSMNNQIGFTKSFDEPGYILGFACARADITYQQGIERFWSRRTRFDFFWPEFENLGEQAILMKEIYATGTSADNDVFGYQERFGDYRYKPSLITGKFRSTDPQSLDFWHMAEEFGTAPVLNGTFLLSNTPIERAIAVPSEPDLLVDMWFKYIATRPMAANPTPVGLGRF